MIGKTISHYKILEKLGEGGMGVVYKAEDTKLKRIVALKFLSNFAVVSKEEKVRFVHEAQAAAALDHPNICTVHEIDEVEGQTFIAMAYIKGQSLKEEIETNLPKVLNLLKVLEYTIQIAEGMQAAHEKGIVHRDIKPANILITEKDQVRITDFGLAKLAGRTQLTKEGTSMGTVAYMSPEQAQGAEVDHRTDIWALGVVLYEMLTGELPFKGEYEQAMVYSIMNEEPKPVTGLRSRIPMKLEQLINKALSKNPAERYQHMDEVLVDLKTIQNELSRGTETLETVDNLVKPKTLPRWMSHKVSALPGILVIVLAALLAFWWIEKTKEPAVVKNVAKKLAVLPFVNLTADSEQEYFCDGMTEQLITNLSRLSELKVIARTSVMRYKNTQKDIREISGELGAPFILEGSVRKSGNTLRVTAQLIQADEGTHLWANDYDRELKDIFVIQDDVSQSIATALEVTFSKQTEEVVSASYPANVAAYDVYLKARHYVENIYLETKKEADFQQALKLAEQAVTLDPEFARGYLGLGYLYENHWIVTGDQDDLKQVGKYISTAYELNPRLPETNAAMGYQFLLKKNFDTALSFMKSALELNGRGWEVYHLIGLFCGFTGLYEQAIQYFSKAVELNPFNIHTISNRGWYRLVSGYFQGALQDFEKGYAIQPDHIPNLNGYAFALMMLEQYERADKILTLAESLPPGAFGNRLPTERALYYAASGAREKALSTSKWGGVLAVLGMKNEALDFIDKATRDENGDYFLLTYLPLIHLPIYDSLRSEPRFQEIVKKEKEKYEMRLQKYSIPIID